jgi:hypothetical protein
MTRDAVLVMRSNTRGAVAALLQLCCSSVAAVAASICNRVCASEAIALQALLQLCCSSVAAVAASTRECKPVRSNTRDAMASEAHTRVHIEAATAATELQQSL